MTAASIVAAFVPTTQRFVVTSGSAGFRVRELKPAGISTDKTKPSRQKATEAKSIARSPGELCDFEGVVLTTATESTDIYRDPPELPRDLVQAALLALESGDAGLARSILRHALGRSDCA